MRVRVKPGLAPSGQTMIEGWLRHDQEYVVLEIVDNLLRLERGEGDAIPPVWERDLFEVVDGSLPPNWIAAIGGSGRLYLAPRSWFEADFWSALDDDEPPEQMTWAQRTERYKAARQTFEREVSIIIEADRMSRETDRL